MSRFVTPRLRERLREVASQRDGEAAAQEGPAASEAGTGSEDGRD